MNYLRERIGSNPPKEKEEARYHERLFSNSRKEFTLVSTQRESLNEACCWFVEKTFDVSIPDIKDLLGKTREISKKYRDLFLERIRQFEKQSAFTRFTDFYDHLVDQDTIKHYRDGLDIDLKYLAACNIPLPGLVLTKDVMKYCGIIKGLIINRAAYLYNFKISSWKPKDDIDVLIQCLRKDGPLMVGGFLGSGYYDKPPIVLSEKIDGKTVYGWKGSKKLEGSDRVGHTVILIGAVVSNGKGFVYFIDPNDPNDPSKQDNVPIYKMSIDSLRERIVPFSDLHHKEFYAYSGARKDFKPFEIKPA